MTHDWWLMTDDPRLGPTPDLFSLPYEELGSSDFMSDFSLFVIAFSDLVNRFDLVLPSWFRKGTVDNLETCVMEIFGSHLTAKAIESSQPCLQLLVEIHAKPDCLTREAMKSFRKSMEEGLLIATAMHNGDKFRESMEIVAEVVRMVSHRGGPDKDLVESKYAFIKEANGCRGRSKEEVSEALKHLVQIATLEISDELMADLSHMHGECIQHSEELYEEAKSSFTEKLEAAMLDDVAIPSEVESVSTMDGISADLLQSHFGIQKSSATSEKVIAMSTLLRDLKQACSFMDVKVSDFLDIRKYEINNRAGLTFLRLGNGFSLIFDDIWFDWIFIYIFYNSSIYVYSIFIIYSIY